MKLTLSGTPGSLVEKQTFVAFKMTGKPAASLPKGLPKAPEATLSWIVMVAKQQWSKVAASLQADPKTKVLIEGYPCLHGSAHVLLATQCTTTALQQATRAGSPDRQAVPAWARDPSRAPRSLPSPEHRGARAEQHVPC